jgi:hypothetical protein
VIVERLSHNAKQLSSRIEIDEGKQMDESDTHLQKAKPGIPGTLAPSSKVTTESSGQ